MRILVLSLFLLACGDGPIESPHEELPEAGQGCQTLEDCPEGLHCLNKLPPLYNIPTGICTRKCVPEEDDCGPNTLCVTWHGFGQSRCWPRCESQECRTDEGWHCEAYSTPGGGDLICTFPIEYLPQ